MERTEKRKVLVAMSGGVDSSVAAALLKEQGYFVVGGFMKNFSAESWAGVLDSDCPWEQDFADVRAVCGKLDIECRSFNFEKEYREKVIEHFFAEYQAGRTPNPDIMCNKEIKFGLFLETAMKLGYDYIATGHYSRVREIPNSKFQIPKYELLKGTDMKKDQSYFLYTLTQDQLKHVLFPIGHLQKSEVRGLARKFGLPNSEKKDSQGLSFVGHINVREFLKQRLPERTGEIVNSHGEVIGAHQGAWYYTIGQRHGLGLGGGEPYYVTKKDISSNTLTVSTLKMQNSPQPSLYQREGVRGSSLYSKAAKLNSIHWIGQAPKLPLTCSAKIRHQQPDQDCIVFSPPARGGDGEGVGELNVQFSSPQFAIAPGQSIVFYDGERVLGGGVIA